MTSRSSVDELSASALRQMSLLESGDYHDFVLKCGDRSFKEHRSIICPQSTMLKVLCSGSWKVNPTSPGEDVKLTPCQEGEAGEGMLVEHDPDIVEHALHFLYTGTYANRIPAVTADGDDTDEEPHESKSLHWKSPMPL